MGPRGSPPTRLAERWRTYLLPSAAWMRSVPLGTPGVSVGKSCVPVPSFRKPILLSGSAVSATEATGSTGRNWHGAGGHPALSRCAWLASNTCSAAIGRPLRHWGHYCRPGWTLLRDAGQRLHGVGSPDCAGTAPFASRYPLQSPGKSSGATLYECPDVPVGKEGCRCRVVVATHPAP